MDNLFARDNDVLRLPVPCTQERGELRALIHLVRTTSPTKVIDLGAFLGGTTYCWATHLGSDVHVAAIDDYETTPLVSYPVPGYDVCPSREDLQALWAEWGDVQCYFGKSDEVFEDVKLDFENSDFLFIDAGHEYEVVKADFEMYKTLVRPNGLVALHDIVNYEGVEENNVATLWEEIKADYDTVELFSRAGQEWMGTGVVLL